MATQAYRIRGIFPAVVTPFDSEGRFVPAAFERLLERVFAAGVDGIYVNGHTGEGLLQPPGQRKEVAEVAVRCAPPGKLIIIHVGAHRTADAVELARHASSIGAHAIASLPPAGAYCFDEIRSYYEALAAASDVPLLVYHYPEIAPGISSLEQIERLLRIPNVAGLKFTDFDLYKLWLIKRRAGCVVLNGHDEVLAAGLLMGADGGVGSFYNLVPELFVELWRMAGEGRWQEAREIQSRINELVEITLRFPLIPAVKTILGWQGIDCGPVLAPRRNLTGTEVAALREALLNSSFAHLAAVKV